MSLRKFQKEKIDKSAKHEDSQPIASNVKYLGISESWAEKIQGKSRNFKNKSKKKTHFIRQKAVLKEEKRAFRAKNCKKAELKIKNARQYKKIPDTRQYIEQSQQDWDNYMFDYYNELFNNYQEIEENSYGGIDDHYYYDLEEYYNTYQEQCYDYSMSYHWRSSYCSYDYGQRQAFGEYRDSSYPWWNPTGLNTWERFMYDFD